MLIVTKIDNLNKCFNIFKDKNNFMHLENIKIEEIYGNALYKNYTTSDINVFIRKTSEKITIIMKMLSNKIISINIEPKEEKNIIISKNQDIILSTYAITKESDIQYKKSKSFSFVAKNILNVNSENIKDFIEKTYNNLSMFLKTNNIDITLFITLLTYIATSIKKMSENSLKEKQGIIVFDKTYRVNLQII